jgi:hypothetical protein
VVTQKIFFRNNDNVNRRIKVLQPDSPFFEVSAAKDPKGGELKQSTVGAGMEVVFYVKVRSPTLFSEYLPAPLTPSITKRSRLASLVAVQAPGVPRIQGGPRLPY